MNKCEKKGTYIAQQIGLKNGVIVQSGTIALLSALKLSNVGIGDNVLINGYCCYSLFEAIKSVGANPVFIIPSNFFNLTDDEMVYAIENYDIKALISTHQYGIVQQYSNIRKKYPNLKIIEDIAQAWDISYEQSNIGEYSDYVVTSFGTTKPLSYGQAGAVFSNNSLHEFFDFHDRESRNSNNVLLPYALYMCESIDEKKLVDNASKIVQKQRIIAECLYDYFKNDDKVKVHLDKSGNNSTWQRFPIVINDPNYLSVIVNLLDKHGIQYQLQNEKEVWELNMVQNTEHTLLMNCDKPLYILVRTRQNEIDNVKKLLK